MRLSANETEELEFLTKDSLKWFLRNGSAQDHDLVIDGLDLGD